MFCANCGKEIDDNVKFCSECGKPTRAEYVPAPVIAPQAVQPQAKVRKDFIDAPRWAKVISVLGFALALVTLAFVWVKVMAPFTYGLAAVGLILCILAMATRNRNVFSLVGMIMNIVIVFIASIQIAVLVNPPYFW